MKNRNINLYLEDILQSLEKIENYMAGMDLEKFRKDEKTQDAVIKNFEVIGEAVKRIPEDFKHAHPGLPWRSAGDMRDFLIHDYPNIVPDVVWYTAKNDLPDFKKQILSLKLTFIKD